MNFKQAGKEQRTSPIYTTTPPTTTTKGPESSSAFEYKGEGKNKRWRKIENLLKSK